MTEETKQLLQQYYNLSFDLIPEPRPKSEWKPENKFGFLLGLTAHGKHAHIIQLHNFLSSNQFKDKEDDFIDNMFDYYIRPFHKSYCESEEPCSIPSRSPSTPSRHNSANDMEYVPPGNELTHSDLKKQVEKRDGVCLFCWNTLSVEGAHIIAQKNIPNAQDLTSVFEQANLTQKHQVQNGLLLCKNCHDQFDRLKRYVDVVEDSLAVKLVNDSNDPASDQFKAWKDEVEDLRGIRNLRERRFVDGRRALDTNGNMALYFMVNNPAILPNRIALEFHKTACFIWRMAGGAEIEDEYCSDDDDLEPVDTAALRRRFNWYDSA